MDLFQSLLSNLWSLFMIVLFFGGSIFVHELGHFLAARRRGVHVERFSIGFGPKIFSWRGKDGVEYRLSWLPFGGYVALPQLADMRGIEGESEAPAKALPPISYATKMIVFGAGAAFNIAFAFLLATLVWLVGQPTTSQLNTTRIGTVEATIELPDGSKVKSPAAEAGLKPGDVIVAVDGRPVDNWLGYLQTLAAGTGRMADGRAKAVLTIDRDGAKKEVTVYPRLAGQEGFRDIGIEGADDLTVEKVLPGSPAEKAGLQPGDRLALLDGTILSQRVAVSEYLQAHADKSVQLTVERAGQLVPLTLQAKLETDAASGKPVYRIGVQYKNVFMVLHPTPWKQLADHVTMTFRVLNGLLSPKSDLGPSKLSGPVGIARGLHSFAQSDIRLVLWFTILVNVNLAIFNLLPIPVLDGGHMAFATIGRLRGRALPANFIATTQSVFIVILFSMILYVSFFDVRRWARDVQAERAETAPAVPAKPTVPAPTPASPAKP